MREDFDKAFSLIIGVEGGYSNDPNDRGGETNFGVSHRAYPDVDIKNLTIKQAKEIYKRDYWDKLHCDDIPSPLCILLFDQGVNQGISAAITDFQRAARIDDDGIIGVHTMEAAKNVTHEQIENYLANRALRYAKSTDFPIYGRGWFKRMFHVIARTLSFT